MITKSIEYKQHKLSDGLAGFIEVKPKWSAPEMLIIWTGEKYSLFV